MQDISLSFLERERQTDKQTDRERDRLRETATETDRQTDTETDEGRITVRKLIDLAVRSSCKDVA